jgi:hypothetical protein
MQPMLNKIKLATQSSDLPHALPIAAVQTTLKQHHLKHTHKTLYHENQALFKAELVTNFLKYSVRTKSRQTWTKQNKTTLLTTQPFAFFFLLHKPQQNTHTHTHNKEQLHA